MLENEKLSRGFGLAIMKFRHVVLSVVACLVVATAWLLVAHGGDRQTAAVKPEDRVCNRDADCRLVEVPCTCGQSKLAVNVLHYKSYERRARCTSVEISHCAAAGAPSACTKGALIFDLG